MIANWVESTEAGYLVSPALVWGMALALSVLAGAWAWYRWQEKRVKRLIKSWSGVSASRQTPSAI